MKTKPILYFLITAFAGSAAAQPQTPGLFDAGRAVLNFNPAVSVVIDTMYYNHSGRETLGHELENLRGFEYQHDSHHGFENGFNLREVELMLMADIDPYFKGWAIVGVDEDGAELEEAVIMTTALPWGLQVKLGKFFSDYSRLNAQHAHAWNFADAPLISQLLFGEGGLNEKGVQLSWLAPSPFYLNFGIEALQGENEHSFDYHGDGPLPRKTGPRAFMGWVKAAPNLKGPHAMEFGLFAGRGVHQEEHTDIFDRHLSGHQMLWGADAVYKYSPPGAYGHGIFTLEGGYIARRKDIDLIASTDPAEAGLIGRSQVNEQDGLYLQTVYGFAPRWRAGLRGELLGLTNKSENPAGVKERFDESYRATAMIDWTLTEFSRIRLQGSHGRYDFDTGKKGVSEVFLQLIFSLGAHGAHSF